MLRCVPCIRAACQTAATAIICLKSCRKKSPAVKKTDIFRKKVNTNGRGEHNRGRIKAMTKKGKIETKTIPINKTYQISTNMQITLLYWTESCWQAAESWLLAVGCWLLAASFLFIYVFIYFWDAFVWFDSVALVFGFNAVRPGFWLVLGVVRKLFEQISAFLARCTSVPQSFQ